MAAMSVVVACSSGGGSASAPTAATAPAVAPTPSPSTTAVTVTPSTTTAPAPTAAGPCGNPGAPPARYEHVVWIWMENHTAGAVLASDAAPFERELAARCGSADHYRSVGSPSLPNYLGATSGSTHGVHDDGSPAAHPVSADNLFRQVVAAGGTA